MKTNKNVRVDCTCPIPENRFGIFALHSVNKGSLSDTQLKVVIGGPIATCDSKITEHMAKILDVKTNPGVMS